MGWDPSSDSTTQSRSFLAAPCHINPTNSTHLTQGQFSLTHKTAPSPCRFLSLCLSLSLLLPITVNAIQIFTNTGYDIFLPAGKMDEASKRLRQENGGVSFSDAKRRRLLQDGEMENEGEDVMARLSLDEDDMVGRGGDELVKLLDSTKGDVVGELSRVKFIDNPYSSTLIFQSSSSYVTINGNEESCGSSFSDSESSVMVSVDRGGIASVGCREMVVGVDEYWEGGAWCVNKGEASGWRVDEDEDGGGGGGGGGVMVGWDGSDLDDYEMARFLGEDAAF